MTQAAKNTPQLGAAHTDQSEFDTETTNLDLIKRRQNKLGASILFYHDPVHIVRGEGVWLYDDRGRKYLDCYNNVASVGHCNQHVVAALSQQASTLNTHSRYLHEGAIDYAEKLTSKMPDGLDICMFVCTGTEANELAARIARAVTGNNGLIVMENSYHGNSTLMTEASSAFYAGGITPPDHIVAVEPPNAYRGPLSISDEQDAADRYAALIDDGIEALNQRKQGVAAFMCDTIFDMQGTLEAPADYFEQVYLKVRDAGGLCIADEVQAGLCRTGKWWGFEHYDVVPDIVTLGKPMGDGHPLAVLVTSREIAEKFAKSSVYFNTFGGNPVSMAVGKAVLEICEQQDLPSHCNEVGDYLRGRLDQLKQKHSIIGNIRGHGLFLGMELVHDHDTLEPATDVARTIPDAMKNEGVLMGLSGRYGNVLKFRPPLVFSKANVDMLIETLDRVLP